jgi:hypothetical protein
MPIADIRSVRHPSPDGVDGSNGMEIEGNDPRNVRAGGRTRPQSLQERQCNALESIADSLARIYEEMVSARTAKR